MYDSYMRIDQIRYSDPSNEEHSPSGLPSVGRPNVSNFKLLGLLSIILNKHTLTEKGTDTTARMRKMINYYILG